MSAEILIARKMFLERIFVQLDKCIIISHEYMIIIVVNSASGPIKTSSKVEPSQNSSSQQIKILAKIMDVVTLQAN